MTATTKKIMIRVIKRRMEAGETLDEIITDYPKLSKAEIKELKESISL